MTILPWIGRGTARELKVLAHLKQRSEETKSMKSAITI